MATIWNEPPTPTSTHNGSTAHSGGFHMLAASGAQDRMASQPIAHTCVEGLARRPISMAPSVVPVGTDAISRPTVMASPPIARAYGAASPSVTM
jgi:hypothetical protein